MSYSIDLKDFTIDKLRYILQTKRILPGRKILLVDIDERMDILEKNGIDSMENLLDTLGTKNKIKLFANESGLDEEYLTILRREVNSFVPKPVKITELPYENTDLLEKIYLSGINTSEKLYLAGLTKNDRVKLATSFDCSSQDIVHLIQLCDLLRIAGVGPVFANIIHGAGIHTAGQFLSSSPEELVDLMNDFIENKGMDQFRLKTDDLRYCFDLSSELPITLQND